MKTVKDLIAVLEGLEPNLIVALSSDEEGNQMNPWSGGIGFAVHNDFGERFSGYTYETDEDGWDDEDTEQPVTESNATAIILWP